MVFRHTSLFTRCGTTACVPFLSVFANRDLFPINTILLLLFRHFTCLLSNKSFQSRLFRLFCSTVFLLCASPSTCPAKDTVRNIRAGQFQDMLGIEEGIKRIKEENRQYTRQIIKYHDWRENCREKEHYFFSKQETAPDLKKEMLKNKEKTQEHNFRKILQKKSTFRSILPEDMQSEDVHNLWQEEKLLPPCHKLC